MPSEGLKKPVQVKEGSGSGAKTRFIVAGRGGGASKVDVVHTGSSIVTSD